MGRVCTWLLYLCLLANIEGCGRAFLDQPASCLTLLLGFMQGVLQARRGGTSLAMADQAPWPVSAAATLQWSAQPPPAQQHQQQQQQQQQGVPEQVDCEL
jgi:hypothetical protein